MNAEKLITPADRDEIKAAIKKAEKVTSGEVRVVIEDTCKADVLDRTALLFHKLKMDQTKERNGVLIYVSVDDHKFAIIGDAGIHKIVKDDFWNKIKEDMAERFRQGHIAEGIIHAIHEAGKALSHHFPCRTDDHDELSDEIFFGDGK
ncbi:MAG TPA: TPM domain-containing protein [Bacteroidia bacterium]|nr:TPM domain-containing protein [Bacteroidia bacterium]